MPLLMRAAQQVLRDWRNQHVAGDAIYRRGAIVETVRATQAATTVTLDDGQTISKSRVADWLIDVDQLAAKFGEPVRGDQVEYDGVRYEVADIAGSHCWGWHGSLRQTYRIHSKQVPLTETA